MMPVIRISDTTHRKLQKIAIPLVDNPDTLIGRLVDAAVAGVPYQLPGAEEDKKPITAPEPTASVVDIIRNHPDLTHTKVREASFDGVEIAKPNWNNLVKHAHEIAFQQLGTFQALRKATFAHLREGKYDGEGFSYLASIDVSIQGMDSNLSWENSKRLAQLLGVPIHVGFEWYSKPNAARPGQSETLEWQP